MRHSASAFPGGVTEGRNQLDVAADAWQVGDPQGCKSAAQDLQRWSATLPQKSLARQMLDLGGSLLFAAIGALIIRNSWFELYHVPTGSMRPTIAELDRLVVTKTAFGLNRPLHTTPFFFDPTLLERGQIVTFTSHGLEMDGKTRHFGLFPGYRRLVKRLWALGGDLVYFYGGGVYILDQKGQTHILPAESLPLMGLEVVPLIDLRGRLKERSDAKGARRFAVTSFGIELTTNCAKRVGDDREAQTPLPWGMDRYAQVGLVPRLGVPYHAREQFPLDADWWLEIYHHPRWGAKKVLIDEQSYPIPEVASLSLSYLPLHNEALERLRSGLYTARFRVQGGFAQRIEANDSQGVPVPNVDDGDFEVQDGRVYRIGFGGNATRLEMSHPLAQLPLLPTLFNAGTDFALEQLRLVGNASTLPRRFAYFREGALHVMNRQIFDAHDPLLKRFCAIELDMQKRYYSHSPFIDQGPPPIIDQQLDEAWMRARALQIPMGHTLLLGDNHARSGDSREFGFVPETNIQGTPLFTFWPLSSAKKCLKRPEPPHWTLYRQAVWAIAIASAVGYRIVKRHQMRRVVLSRPWRKGK